MIQLTNDFYMTADNHQYIVGTLWQRPGRDASLENPRYYTTAREAVLDTVTRAMRLKVSSGEITTLKEFQGFLEQTRRDFEEMLLGLDE